MNLSNYAEEKIINVLFRGVNYTATDTYVSLHTAAGASESTAAWLATELTTGSALSYARVHTTASDWSDPVGTGISDSVNDITFPVAGSDWGDVTHVAFWDAATVGTGNLKCYAALPATRSINNGDAMNLTAGNVSLTLT